VLAVFTVDVFYCHGFLYFLKFFVRFYQVFNVEFGTRYCFMILLFSFKLYGDGTFFGDVRPQYFSRMFCDKVTYV
jgi:hypothetical protein